MNWLYTMLLALLAIAVLAMIWFTVRFLAHPADTENRALNGLMALRDGKSSRDKAEGFVALMASGVVGIHTITNKGKAYRDQRQSEVFKAGLTDSHMQALLSIPNNFQ